ncbi:MAG: polymer-forming cytoskeletal protein [Bacteroidales bacterium]|nr:polymer-forming cytoskeletal protein [Bacteroidales bacterium]
MADNVEYTSLENDLSLFSKSSKITQLEFESDGDVRIDGNIKGIVKTKGKVIVGPDGVFEGEMISNKLDVSGKATGSFKVADMTSLFDSAVFTGDLVTGRITIDPEVTFNATCRMFQKEERKKLLESL